MKIQILIITLLVFTNTILAQFGEQQVNSNTAIEAFRVKSGDLDGDSFEDVIVHYQGHLSWYKNIDGEGNFGSENTIINNLTENIINIIARDMDSDEDKDILFQTSGNIYWIENMNGLGLFETFHTIFESEDFVVSFILKDVNGDNYLDIICSNVEFGSEIIWFENLSNSGTFGNKQVVDENLYPLMRYLVSGDLDGDGDNDIVIARRGFGSFSGVCWYENLDGMGNFSEVKQIFLYHNLEHEGGIHLHDIDLDGDNDIVFVKDTDFGASLILWLENLDGLGQNWSNNEINWDSNIASSELADVNNDGFIDILYSSSPNSGEDEIFWIRNDNGSFENPITVTQLVDTPQEISVAYINSDNRIDVLSASSNDNKIAWYENLGVLGIGDNFLNKIEVYPNPVKDVLTINTNQQIDKIEILNFNGQKLKTFLFQNKVDLNSLNSGIYLVKIFNDIGEIEIIKIVKQ